MSHLFEHNGAGGKGYSQPEPIFPADNIQIPTSLVRSNLPRWPRISEPEWFAITHGCQVGILELIRLSIHLGHAL